MGETMCRPRLFGQPESDLKNRLTTRKIACTDENSSYKIVSVSSSARTSLLFVPAKTRHSTRWTTKGEERTFVLHHLFYFTHGFRCLSWCRRAAGHTHLNPQHAKQKRKHSSKTDRLETPTTPQPRASLPHQTKEHPAETAKIGRK